MARFSTIQSFPDTSVWETALGKINGIVNGV